MIKADFDPLNAAAVGHALEGFGVNLLVRDVALGVAFLQNIFEFELITPLKAELKAELSAELRDYALLMFRGHFYQLHADHTYANHPLASLCAESAPRGGGVELRLFQVDADECERRARAGGYQVLMATADKPHGLRECFLLDPDGYCWVPSMRI